MFWEVFFPRKEWEERGDATVFGKRAQVSTLFRDVVANAGSSLASFFQHRERANRKVGGAGGREGGRGAKGEVHSSLARCNVYILRLQPTLVTFYAPVTLPSLSTFGENVRKAAAPWKRISLFYSNGVSECSLT